MSKLLVFKKLSEKRPDTPCPLWMSGAVDSRQSRTSDVKEVAFELTPAGKD